ncbi:MAG TPA: prenyltransferase/squalene oxidase repeat-containing protein [Gemmataceae bacterium]|nr:prenyltransferase/squalene oxidase repeat-containing protein [Gemmataceae bacterium]
MSAALKQSLKLIAEEIVKKQQADGSWEFFATLRRPPINESQTTDAAWIIMALEGETGPDAPESQRAALSKAITWLDTAKRSDIHQDKVLKVLRGVRSAKPRKTMQTTIDELLALQRADGGWSQTVPELKSDAFATGQTLYVLSLAGFTAERPEIKRGIDFLVTTREPAALRDRYGRHTFGQSCLLARRVSKIPVPPHRACFFCFGMLSFRVPPRRQPPRRRSGSSGRPIR